MHAEVQPKVMVGARWLAAGPGLGWNAARSSALTSTKDAAEGREPEHALQPRLETTQIGQST